MPNVLHLLEAEYHDQNLYACSMCAPCTTTSCTHCNHELQPELHGDWRGCTERWCNCTYTHSWFWNVVQLQIVSWKKDLEALCVFIKASKLQKNCKRHILSWSHLLSHSHILISLNNTKHFFPFVITIIFGPIAISCAFFLEKGHTSQYFMQRFSHSKLLTCLLLECICKMICTKTWHVGVSPPTL